jgi:hypothetical protein
MPIEEQAKYCDYVTNKIAELPSDKILPYVRYSLTRNLSRSYKECNTCSIANVARMILLLPDGERQTAEAKFIECLNDF